MNTWNNILLLIWFVYYITMHKGAISVNKKSVDSFINRLSEMVAIIGILPSTMGVTTELLLKIIKSRNQKVYSKDIINSFSNVQKQLIDTKNDISTLLSEVEKQKENFIELKEKADLNMQTIQFTDDEVNAIEKVLSKSVVREGKKTQN